MIIIGFKDGQFQGRFSGFDVVLPDKEVKQLIANGQAFFKVNRPVRSFEQLKRRYGV